MCLDSEICYAFKMCPDSNFLIAFTFITRRLNLMNLPDRSIKVMGRYYWQISILSKWLQWLNMEESVVDAKILDHVSDPLPQPLDSPTRTPVSDSIVSESPQFFVYY